MNAILLDWWFLSWFMQRSHIELFRTEIDDKLLGNIRKNINKGLALGNEVLTNARVSSRKSGRPKKNVE